MISQKFENLQKNWFSTKLKVCSLPQRQQDLQEAPKQNTKIIYSLSHFHQVQLTIQKGCLGYPAPRPPALKSDPRPPAPSLRPPLNFYFLKLNIT